MCFLTLLTLAAVFADCSAVRFVPIEQGGNIVLRAQTGDIDILTSTGRDFDPSLSFDGSSVVFCRRDNPEVDASAIYSINVKTRAERLLFSGPVLAHGRSISNLGSPQTGPLQDIVYFLANHSVTEGSLMAYSTKDSTIKYIAEAATFMVIRQGSYSGNLLLYQRKRTQVGEPLFYYVYWLYAADGHDMGIAGPAKMDISRLKCP